MYCHTVILYNCKMEQIVVSKWWIHYKDFFGTTEENIDLDTFLQELRPLCETYQVKVFGKEYESKRVSTTFKSEGKINHNYYSTFASRPWEESPTVVKIRDILLEHLDEEFDYCLAHIYRDGKDKIDWHADKEAMKSIVVSISFGATRKFRFREIGQKSGYSHELILQHGDMVIMKEGCQKRYQHCIPCEKTVKTPRINLTFRKYE